MTLMIKMQVTLLSKTFTNYPLKMKNHILTLVVYLFLVPFSYAQVDTPPPSSRSVSLRPCYNTKIEFRFT